MGTTSVSTAGSPVDIAITGLRAESLRMNVIANNIANANTVDAGGQPYRRQQVLLATDPRALEGVTTGRVVPDLSTDFRRVYQPGHPSADGDGYVLMPNVELPVEMIQLIAASRAYQANAAVLKRYQEAVDQALELLR